MLIESLYPGCQFRVCIPAASWGRPGNLTECCVLRRVRSRRGLHRRLSIECCLRKAPTQSVNDTATCGADSAGVRAESQGCGECENWRRACMSAPLRRAPRRAWLRAASSAALTAACCPQAHLGSGTCAGRLPHTASHFRCLQLALLPHPAANMLLLLLSRRMLKRGGRLTGMSARSRAASAAVQAVSAARQQWAAGWTDASCAASSACSTHSSASQGLACSACRSDCTQGRARESPCVALCVQSAVPRLCMLDC